MIPILDPEDLNAELIINNGAKSTF